VAVEVSFKRLLACALHLPIHAVDLISNPLVVEETSQLKVSFRMLPKANSAYTQDPHRARMSLANGLQS